MPRLIACPSCHGFVANPLAACPHCDATPPPRRRLMGLLASVLLATAGSITLMACYGVSPSSEPCTDDDGTCYEYCLGDSDCVTGDYCNVAYNSCEYGGYCNADVQCPDGYECDELRTTCIPDGETPCGANGDCAWGAEVCDVVSGDCVPATYCAPGELGCAEGTRCDPEQSVCMPCEGDACGTCSGTLTCGAPAPLCPEGTTAAVGADGCWTGSCVSAASCADEACAPLDEAACVVSDTCEAVYQGVNCTDPDGDPCSGQGTCTCESFLYDRCVASPT